MQQHLALLLAAFVLVSPCHAQSGYWRDSTGAPIPETESMRSKQGFAGSLLLTTDEDWQAKWNTPQDTRPSFNRAETVPFGKKVFALILFANPLLDGFGHANVRCDLRLTDPQGKATLSEKNRKCFAGRLKGNPANLVLAEPVVGFSGDRGDPPGTWVFDVTLRDVTRSVELPLRTTFALQ